MAADTPAACVARLDAALVRRGEDVMLKRLSGAAQTVAATAACRAMVRDYVPQELVGAIVQGDTRVTLSPTHLTDADWPDNAIRKGDKIVIQGRVRNVEAAAPVYMAGMLVRVELQVRG